MGRLRKWVGPKTAWQERAEVGYGRDSGGDEPLPHLLAKLSVRGFDGSLQIVGAGTTVSVGVAGGVPRFLDPWPPLGCLQLLVSRGLDPSVAAAAGPRLEAGEDEGQVLSELAAVDGETLRRVRKMVLFEHLAQLMGADQPVVAIKPGAAGMAPAEGGPWDLAIAVPYLIHHAASLRYPEDRLRRILQSLVGKGLYLDPGAAGGLAEFGFDAMGQHLVGLLLNQRLGLPGLVEASGCNWHELLSVVHSLWCFDLIRQALVAGTAKPPAPSG